MFILSSISSDLEFWSVKHTFNIWKFSSNRFWKRNYFFGEISSNWQNDLLGTNVYKTLEFCW